MKDTIIKEQTKCYCGHTTTCDCGPKQETLEEVAESIHNLIDEYVNDVMGGCNLRFEEWFKQFKKK